jgi:hypothetical protein
MQDKPISSLNIADEKKVDVLLTILENTRSGISSLTNQSYTATVWSITLMISVCAFWLSTELPIEVLRWLLICAILIFTFLTQWYLWLLRSFNRSGGRTLVQIEAALQLCNENAYIKDLPFFKYTGEWLPPYQLVQLSIFHMVVSVFVVIVLILTK